MGCCGQNPVGSGAVAVDGCKRVNYTLGMLLGVDDFVQETAYHTARRCSLAREMLGYGTVRGLDVAIEPGGDKGPCLRVRPGAAWLPSGTPVCVEAEQCCYLNDWLAARAGQVERALADDSPPANIVLHVVLSYAPCLTDNVIIPGEPCRSEDELMQPSRVADGFRLELRLSAPTQREEDAIRDFVDWLSAIRVVTDSPPLDEDSFVEQLKAAAHAWLVPTSPPETDDFMVGTPPAGLRANGGLRRAALRLWATELRPLWMARTGCCGGQQPAGEDDAVLLATLDVPLVSTGAGGWRVSDASDDPITIDQRRRPVLLSLRMVQELIRQSSTVEAGDSVVAADAFGLPPVAGTGEEYSRADHSHGTPELPPLSGDLEGLLGESLSPPQPPRVVGLRGQPLADVAPANGQTLVFDGTQWVPGSIAAPAANFVGRGRGPFEIVAAGEIVLDLASGIGTFGRGPTTYGNLRGTDTGRVSDGQRMVMALEARVADARTLRNYIVKLMPMFPDDRGMPFRLFLRDSVESSRDAIAFKVLLLSDKPIDAGAFQFRFQVEVSRF